MRADAHSPGAKTLVVYVWSGETMRSLPAYAFDTNEKNAHAQDQAHEA